MAESIFTVYAKYCDHKIKSLYKFKTQVFMPDKSKEIKLLTTESNQGLAQYVTPGIVFASQKIENVFFSSARLLRMGQ